MNSSSTSFNVVNLPVYWRVKENTVSHQHIPSRHDIIISTEEGSGRLKQDIDTSVRSMLFNIYNQDENIGYIQDNNSLASPYHDDLLRVILREVIELSGISILEIGCGGCTLLENLAKLGAKVTGLDPSPFSQRVATAKNIRLIPHFFEPKLIQDQYDLVYFSDVLEHVEDPAAFLRQVKTCLTDGSKIIIAVPDASMELDTGDFSMLMHQHISYFNKKSLYNTIVSSGLTVKTIERAGYGGSLYAVAEVKENDSEAKELIGSSSSYLQKANNAASYFHDFFQKVKRESENIYCYVPLRALPYLSKIDELDSPFIKLIDDTPFWEDMYIDGVAHRIKPLAKCKINHNDSVLIFSNTFGSLLKEKVNQTHPICRAVYEIKDFIDKK